MKKIVVLLLTLGIFLNAVAQNDHQDQTKTATTIDSSLLYLRFPIVPSFKLTNISDSSIFTKDNLKKKKATIIMVFSPDCENCQEETRDLTRNIHLFKKAQIIMVSPLEFGILRKFYEEYKIANYPTITMGRDPGYFLGTFYKVRSFPSIFVYNKKGKLVKNFIGAASIAELAAAIK